MPRWPGAAALVATSVITLLFLATVPFEAKSDNCHRTHSCPSPSPIASATPTPTPTPMSPSPSAPSPTPPPVGVFYGTLNTDTLANTQVGGTSCGCLNLQSSYRFRSVGGALVSVRIYVVDGVGYAGGNGGTVQISVQGDDGTANHAPSGTVLASTLVSPGNPVNIGYLPLITFPSPTTLTAGSLYHIVFTNVDANPTVNYVSINSLYVYGTTLVPRQPGVSDTDWGQMLDTGSGWAIRNNFTPILDLGYADGAHQGQGYMEVWVRGYQLISGSAQVREEFTPTIDHTVTGAAVRLRRSSGTSPLTLSLELANGTPIDSADVAAATIPISTPGDNGGAAWGIVTFPGSHTLTAGTTYVLRLSTQADTTYSLFVIRKGTSYSFSPATYFPDGNAQWTSDAATWQYFGYTQTQHDPNADLQFYFR